MVHSHALGVNHIFANYHMYVYVHTKQFFLYLFSGTLSFGFLEHPEVNQGKHPRGRSR